MCIRDSPGKKLNFMGNELGHFREWDEKRELDWDLLKYPFHDAFQKYFAHLSRVYSTEPALYDGEYNPDCFEWVACESLSEGVYALSLIHISLLLIWARLFPRPRLVRSSTVWTSRTSSMCPWARLLSVQRSCTPTWTCLLYTSMMPAMMLSTPRRVCRKAVTKPEHTPAALAANRARMGWPVRAT